MSTLAKSTHNGLRIPRLLSTKNTPPLETVEWENRDAVITSMKGDVVFEQKGVRVPKFWSQTATNIAASKYLHGKIGTDERETGVDVLIRRVVTTITQWGDKDGYFANPEVRDVFEAELTHLLVGQYAAFNSPVWFNVGVSERDSNVENWHWHFDKQTIVWEKVGYSRPQCAACFINGLEDSLSAILELAKTEGMLFKMGSGTGTNLSAIRGDGELLAGGGIASGPLSFMKGYDAFAGVIKSGGKTRRAAKMVMLNIDHPDIQAFIACKMKEEAKAKALMAAGYDGSGPDSEAYSSIFFQNANNSVRVSDEFMLAVANDMDWNLKSVTTGETCKTVKARDLMQQIAEATWAAGDPGVQYDTTINKMHTSKASGRINASNPCSEFMFLDDTACNLASLNLRKFMKADGTFDVNLFQHAINILIVAQDILVDNSGYPTEVIAKNSHDFRPLGLGYANLGGLLLELGLAYDSACGRDFAACITSIMTGTAYAASAEIAAAFEPLVAANESLIINGDGRQGETPKMTGAFPGYFVNAKPMMEVIGLHKAAAEQISTDAPSYLRNAAISVWSNVVEMGRSAGFRNAQVTVLAPTGTIGFMMDCDTTGVEPLFGMVVSKKLVGGGTMILANETLTPALKTMGYTDDQILGITEYVRVNGTVEGSEVREEHYAVFDCAVKAQKGTRTISWKGHLEMMAAVQPFLSGAISKTINMPNEATVEDIVAAYVMAWELGIKSVAIYRDGSKMNQVLNVKGSDDNQLIDAVEAVDMGAPPKPNRHRLQDERSSTTHHFKVGQHEGYLTVGLYPNGQPGEIFITMSKQGSTMSGMMDVFATSVSVGLQYGVPLQTLVTKFAHTRFEPSGWSGKPEIGYANSIPDYIFRWLENRFIKGEQLLIPGVAVEAVENVAVAKTGNAHSSTGLSAMLDMGDAPMCSECGAIMIRNGACYKCTCGSTSGCS
jgi:ribonucleoside-diphosphate reductase alpha chain